MARRTTTTTTAAATAAVGDTTETTGDTRRQGLAHIEYNLNPTTKHVHTLTPDDINRKDCK